MSAIVLGLVAGLVLVAMAILWFAQSGELMREAAELQPDQPFVPVTQTVELWAMLGAGVVGIAGAGAALARRLTVAAVLLGVGAGIAFLGPPFAIPRLASAAMVVAVIVAAAAARGGVPDRGAAR